LYGILILLLVTFHLLIKRLNIRRENRSILFTVAILVSVLIVTAIQPLWYSLFELIGLVENVAGKWRTIPNSLDTMLMGVKESDQAVFFVSDAFDKSFIAFRVFIFAYLIQVLLSYFVWDGILFDEEMNESVVPKILRQIITGLIFLIAVFIIVLVFYPTFMNGFLTITGTSGVMAGLFAQQPIKKALTALSLNINKAIRKGDFIEVGEFSGTVREIGWNSIKLITVDDNLLTIPNTNLVASNYINYSRPALHRYVTMEVMLKTAIAPQKAQNALIRAAKNSKLVINEPKASLIRTENIFSYYEVRVCTDHDLDNEVRNEVLSAIWYLLRREGLQSAPEGYTLENPQERAKVLLNNIPVFEPFTDEEDTLIAERAQFERYGYPEKIVVEKDTDSALYIIAEGNVEVLVKQPNGSELQVARLGKNNFFGEMALLTGEPRGATVRALDEVLVCKITKEVMREILSKRPEILELLSEKLAEKQLSNQKFIDKHALESEEAKKKKGVKNKLLDLMSNFFKEEQEEVAKADNSKLHHV
jgi:CRP-like cAMP-binding protein